MTPDQEIESLVADIAEAGWPEGLAAERAAMEAEAPAVAADVVIKPRRLADRAAETLTVPHNCDLPPGTAGSVLYFHGGGYVYGSLSSHRGLVGEIARESGCPVTQIDYRLAPEHAFPAALTDAASAVREFYAEGVAPNALVVVGDSAGGGLVLATLQVLRDSGDPLPAAAVCMSPWTDLTCSGSSYDLRASIDPMIDRTLAKKLAALCAGGVDPADARLSPLFGDPTMFPPLLIQVGAREVLFDDAALYAARARAAGVSVTFEEWPDMIHVWQLYFPRLTAARQAIARIGAFIRSALRVDAEEISQ